ncbi:MAG: hypothetical protein DME17_15055 [Candidatus Rokuibacteriota bacterium]|nr:MAG: hypothetical protein DME17_15055 [Candidatus Rokubacteria bacterium]
MRGFAACGPRRRRRCAVARKPSPPRVLEQGAGHPPMEPRADGLERRPPPEEGRLVVGAHHELYPDGPRARRAWPSGR